MEIIKSNFLETTGSINVSSNTTASKYLFSSDPTFQYTTTNAGTDATTSSITISFDRTMTVNRIALKNHNLKSFTIFYNGVTANTFSITTTSGITNTTNFSTNSESSMFLRVNSVACTSVTIDMKTTIVPDNEKAIGFLFISEKILDFPVVPSADRYKPVLNPNSVEHKLSTGGKRIHKTGDKWQTSIELKYIDQDFRDDLKEIFDLYDSFSFCPWGTATAWDKILFESCWTNSFDFYKFSENAATAGFSGKIDLEEL